MQKETQKSGENFTGTETKNESDVQVTVNERPKFESDDFGKKLEKNVSVSPNFKYMTQNFNSSSSKQAKKELCVFSKSNQKPNSDSVDVRNVFKCLASQKSTMEKTAKNSASKQRNFSDSTAKSPDKNETNSFEKNRGNAVKIEQLQSFKKFTHNSNFKSSANKKIFEITNSKRKINKEEDESQCKPKLKIDSEFKENLFKNRFINIKNDNESTYTTTYTNVHLNQLSVHGFHLLNFPLYSIDKEEDKIIDIIYNNNYYEKNDGFFIDKHRDFAHKAPFSKEMLMAINLNYHEMYDNHFDYYKNMTNAYQIINNYYKDIKATAKEINNNYLNKKEPIYNEKNILVLEILIRNCNLFSNYLINVYHPYTLNHYHYNLIFDGGNKEENHINNNNNISNTINTHNISNVSHVNNISNNNDSINNTLLNTQTINNNINSLNNISCSTADINKNINSINNNLISFPSNFVSNLPNFPLNSSNKKSAFNNFSNFSGFNFNSNYGYSRVKIQPQPRLALKTAIIPQNLSQKQTMSRAITIINNGSGLENKENISANLITDDRCNKSTSSFNLNDLSSNKKKQLFKSKTIFNNSCSKSMDKASNGPSNYKCEFCLREFKNGQALGGHISQAHPNQSSKYKTKVEIRNSRKDRRELIYEARRILYTKLNISEEEMINMEKKKKREILNQYKNEYKKILNHLKISNENLFKFYESSNKTDLESERILINESRSNNKFRIDIKEEEEEKKMQ